ncbi:Cof-type HAD-IIB family hydrolase [Aneurinibacillus tyrosinisolvens]|uniref:Cof-type HAD-IIB family hydrolase n=1 Tax=Aneurinibacillus tyrosinisolvens TaxID=1443435 RepID=UPI00063F615B|nr:Cof-type HAD-IIB family hydrolase [Aneurinibacillus tyrosinisolvens]
MVRLIALDMDGTLLNSKGEISEANAASIREAQNNGCIVAIATGRPYYNAKAMLEQAGLSCPIIGVNGASIFLETGEELHSVPLEQALVEQILTRCKQLDIYCEIYTDKFVYTDDLRGKAAVEIDILQSGNKEVNTKEIWTAIENHARQTGFVPVSNMREMALGKGVKVHKILAFSLIKDKLEKAAAQLERFGLSITSSGDNNIEINHKEASKGKALEVLAAYYNIPLRLTMAAGDNLNDLSMLAAAGFGVAMGNAKDEVKNACTYRTKTNDEDGVAYAIRAFIEKTQTIGGKKDV